MDKRRWAARIAAVGGGGLALLGAANIALVDLDSTRWGYLSELGVTGEPTAASFHLALWTTVLGIITLAGSVWLLGSPGVRVRRLTLGVAGAMVVSAVAFAVVAEIPCSDRCEFPARDGGFDPANAAHFLAVAVGLTAGIAAMGILALRAGRRRLRLASALLVAVAAAGTAALAVVGAARLSTDVSGALQRAVALTSLGWIATVSASLTFGKNEL